MTTLVELLQFNRTLEDEIVKNEGEVTPEVFEALVQLQTLTPQKIDCCIAFLDDCESTAEAFEEKAKAMKAKATTYRKAAERFKEYVKFNMKMFEFLELSGEDYRFCLERSAISVEVDEQVISSLPDHLKRVKMEPNKTAIKEALEAGDSIEGCRLVRGEKLQIRIADKKRKKNELPKSGKIES